MSDGLESDAFTGKDMIADVVVMLETISDKSSDELESTAGLILLYVATKFKGKILGKLKGDQDAGSES